MRMMYDDGSGKQRTWSKRKERGDFHYAEEECPECKHNKIKVHTRPLATKAKVCTKCGWTEWKK